MNGAARLRDARAWARRDLAPLAAVVLGALAFRAPTLINASGVNSDAAVVGLQAMHLLRGEHAVFLWGSGYQTSVDSYWAAALFAVFGASPLVLVLSALSLHVALVGLAWSILRRRTEDAWLAAALVVPLVLSTAAVDSYALNPPRQASLTLAFAAIALADRGRAAAAGLAALLAFYADPYAALLAPAAAIVAAVDRRALGRFAAGAALGAIPVVVRMRLPAAQHGVFSMSPDVLAHNARLLWDPCGPWFLGTTVWTAPHGGAWGPWRAPLAIRALEFAGGAAFFATIALGLALAWRSRRAPLGRLAAGGAAAMLLTLAGFLASRMVMDAFSMRYLAAIALVMPLVAAPAARLGRARFFALYAPCAAAFAISGWMTQAPYVDGLLPARVAAASGAAENELAARLAERGVGYAVADYWTAYRTTFVTGERLVAVPIHASQDRYAPYREAFERAGRFAYVFDSERSGEDPREAEAGWARDADAVDRVESGQLRAVVFARRAGGGRVTLGP